MDQFLLFLAGLAGGFIAGLLGIGGGMVFIIVLPFALLQKRRLDARNVKMLSMVGEVKEKNVLLADDMCSTAGTLLSAAKICREKGAKRIFACVTHGLFVGDALERIQKSPIEQVFVSSSIPQDTASKKCSKICVVSIAPSFAAAIARRVHISE